MPIGPIRSRRACRGPVLLPILSVTAALCLGLPLPARAVTWIVDPSGVGDALTIQAGINLAAAGDTVQIARGTYRVRQNVLKSYVHVRSETGEPDCVTIDMEGHGRAFWGARVYGGSITGITMMNGSVDWGGAVYTVSESSFTIQNCVFTNNTALIGGAIYSHHSHVEIHDCTFSGNTATYFGGAIALDHESGNHIDHCTFTNNTAGDYGGAVWGYVLSAPEFGDCRFEGNSAGRGGGGAFFSGTAPTFTNALFTGNAAPVGGAIGGWAYTIDLTNCTLSGNSATQAGGAIWGEKSCSLTALRSIVWGNCAPDGAEVHLVDAPSGAAFHCSNVRNDAGAITGAGAVSLGAGTFSADPTFCAAVDCADAPAEGGTYTLAAGSPCLSENSGGCGAIGAFGAGNCRTLHMAERSWGDIKALYRNGGSSR